MARRFDKFTQAYQHSAVPFVLAEVVTNGAGHMVDLICRFANPAAAELVGIPAESLKNRRFSHLGAPERLRALSPLADVAFSGSAASFSCQTVLGRRLSVTCYQLMYGVCGCILQAEGDAAQRRIPSPSEQAGQCAVVLELGPGGLRGLSCSPELSELAGYSHREFLKRFSDDFTPLVEPRDWPGLLQRLKDGAHAGQTVMGEFRLRRGEGGPIWVLLRAEPVSTGAVAVFSAAVEDIDRQKRGEAELKQARRELAAMQGQLRSLFDHMPGCWMLAQLSAEGEDVESLRVSRGLSELLGYSQTELQKKLLGDRFWRVHPDDREAYAAVLAAAADAAPVQRTVRIQRKGGDPLWLTVSASRLEQADGSALVWTSYADVTGQREAEDALRFHAELNELMLRRAGAVRIDYHLRSDTAQIDGFDPEGQHVRLTVPEYRKSMAESDTIHPDFRKTVAAEVRSACSKPKKSVLHYLGRYLSREYRWYEMSLVSLADVRGNVYRVIANAVDVTGDREAQSRFAAWEQAQSLRGRKALASIRLDLTADRVLDAAGVHPGVLRLLLGNTAQECFLGGQRGVPEAAQRERFASLFSRDALAGAFAQGCAHCLLEHLLRAEGLAPMTVRSAAELAENPQTHHVEAFYWIEGADSRD